MNLMYKGRSDLHGINKFFLLFSNLRSKREILHSLEHYARFSVSLSSFPLNKIVPIPSQA